jgi:hypothetical protein
MTQVYHPEFLKKRISVLFAVISVVSSILWFLPWMMEPNAALGWALVGVFWYFFAWIPAGWVFVLALRRQGRRSLLYWLSFIVILISYGIVFYGASQGYVITV